MSFAPAAVGFATGFSLILAIGAQNAFVLQQGLRQQFVFAVCVTCALSDAMLIATGVAGFGVAMGAVPWLPSLMRVLGAAFLFAYGAVRLHASWRGNYEIANAIPTQSFRAAMLTCLAFTWLNPHVYLDTLALIGAASTRYEGSAKLAFGGGAMLASFVFFFALGYGARRLAPIMSSPRAWRVLDICIGLVMWGLAAILAFGG